MCVTVLQVQLLRPTIHTRKSQPCRLNAFIHCLHRRDAVLSRLCTSFLRISSCSASLFNTYQHSHDSGESQNIPLTAINHKTSNRQQSMCSGQARPRTPRSHDGSGPHPNMGGMLPGQAQQQMGVAAMGSYGYPGMMPYGMMPGMHPQVTFSLLNCLDEDVSVDIHVCMCHIFMGGTDIAYARHAP